ncbi:MAG TPA: ABC transporter ATP-binding protein, partial [Anaerolineae bacterium]|nr:ABC transporter ATP-binding protein [Anaerolineae bacterium]
VPDPREKWKTDIVLPSDEELRTYAESGCHFYPRCPYRMDRCLIEQPPLHPVGGPDHQAACFLYENGASAE